MKPKSKKSKKGGEKKTSESVYHFVTVLGCFLEPPLTQESYDKAIEYTLNFIEYRFNKKNIK